MLPQALHPHEGSMAFIAVENVRFKAQGAHQADPADAQHHLLLEAVLVVTTVQLVRDGAVLPVVVGDIRIQKVQRDAAHRQGPYLGMNGAAGKVNSHLEPLAVFVAHRRHRHFGVLLWRVVVYLVAVQRDRLLEIAVAVQQADAQHVHVAIAGFFEVVAGEYAQAAGVQAHRSVQPKFHAEIRHPGAGSVLFVF